MQPMHTPGHPFTVVRRGYEIPEVDAHLETLRRQFTAEIENNRRQMAEIEAELATAREREEAVHLTFLAATKTKEELVGAAQRQLDEATAAAEKEAERITAEAQYKAFRMITDAKENAEATVNQAKAEAVQIAAEATTQADAAMGEARREAMAIINEVKGESAQLVESREYELRAMEERFEREHAELMHRVAEYQAIAVDMEARLRAIAAGSLDEIVKIGALVTGDVDPETGLLKVKRQPRLAGRDTDEDESAEGTTRGSYYNRRSAKLPRLGEAATGSALAAVSVLRERVILEQHQGHGTDIDEDDESHLVTQPA